MPRSYARKATAMWRDADWCALSPMAQWAYDMLYTQADISAAGVLPVTLRRWSKFATGLTADALSACLSELVAKTYVVLDNDTEELLVRSFIRHDGGFNNPKRVDVIRDSAEAVASPRIRAAIAIELDRLNVSHSLSPSLSDRHSDALPDSPGVVVTERSEVPQPATPFPQPLGPSPKVGEPRKRGHRLPEDWQPTPADIDWARARGISDDQARRSTERFMNHWLDAAGKTATKLNWSRAWRNWLDTDAERAAQHRPPDGSKSRDQQATDDLFARSAERQGIQL